MVPDFLKLQKDLPIITDSDYQILPNISKKLIEKKVKIGDKVSLTFDLKDDDKNFNKSYNRSKPGYMEKFLEKRANYLRMKKKVPMN